MRSLKRNRIKKQKKIVNRLNKIFLSLTMATAFSACTPSYANVNFPDAANLGNNVTVGTDGNTYQIKHGSGKVFENDWNSFNSPSGKTIDFNFSQNGQVSINRVLGNQVSQILGKLTESGAGGNVFLINPHGILFGENASVNLGAFTATTANITSYDLEKGIYKFEQGNIPASIINKGNITISDSGFISLMAPVVKNLGTIQAKSGTIALVSGNKYTLTIANGQDVSINIDKGLSQDLINSEEIALISNNGTIKAGGGSVVLSAKAMENVIQNAVNNDGVISANSVSEVNGNLIFGNVKIDGGDHSLVLNNQIEAKGGTVDINGGYTIINGTVDVSHENGGNINVKADGDLNLNGKLLAKGSSGNGGNIIIDSTGDYAAISDAVIDVSANKGGFIRHTAGGQILTSGKYLATGESKQGGKIHISAPTVKLLGATVDASGASGGEILLGGEKQGAATGILSNSQLLMISKGSTVKADATSQTGDGGTIINWSDGKSYIFADLSAMPGELAEKGGFIEVSGKEYLNFTGDIKTGKGNVKGQILIDPKNIIIGEDESTGIVYKMAITNGFDSISVDDTDKFGGSLAMIDGKLAVGAYQDGAGDKGAVYLFTFDKGSSYEGLTLNQKVSHGSALTGGTTLNLTDGDCFGSSLAMIKGKLAIGAYKDNNKGAVHLFTFTEDTTFENLTNVKKLAHNAQIQLQDGDSFGKSLAIIDGKLAIGAYGDDTNGSNKGAVYLFTFNEGTAYEGLTEVKKLADGVAGLNVENNYDYFGSSLAMTEGKLAIGVKNDGNERGAVHLFTFDENTAYEGLNHFEKITHGFDGLVVKDGDYFGNSLAMIDGKLAIGTGFYDETESNQGAVYLFSFKEGTNFEELDYNQKLTHGTFGLNLAPSSKFGNSIAMIDGKLAIGADGVGSSVHLFTFGGLPSSEYDQYGDNSSDTMYMSASRLAKLLGNPQDIILSANNDITINEIINVNNISGNGGSLTLNAGRSIFINEDITTSNGNLTIIANDSNAILAQRNVGAGSVIMADNTNINAGTGDVNITVDTNSDSGEISLENITAGKVKIANNGTTAGSDVILNGTITSSASGDAVVLSSKNGVVTNNTGDNAINLTGDELKRWLIYSDTPSNTNENFTSYNKRYSVDFGDDISAYNSGNYVFYRHTPTLTVKAIDKTKIYGSTNPILDFILSGLIDGDSQNDALTGGLATTINELTNAGTYADSIVQGSLADKLGYNVVFEKADMTVDKAPLSLVIDNASKTYGQLNPSLNGTFAGFVNGENDSVLDAKSFTTDAIQTSNAGSYNITLSDFNDNNYYLTSTTNGTLTIDKAPLSLIIDNASKIYGQLNPSLNGTFAGFVNGENDSVLDVKSFITDATQASNAGSYNITLDNFNDNNYYISSTTNGVLSVEKAPLSLIIDNTSKVYGQLNPSLSGTFVGLVNGEESSVIDTQVFTTNAIQTSNVGSYDITLADFNDNNYYLTSTTDGILSVNKAQLIVKVNDSSKIEGSVNPVFDSTLTGFVLGQDESILSGELAYNTDADESSAIGNYSISASGLISSNYAITFVDGKLAIKSIASSIAYDDKIKSSTTPFGDDETSDNTDIVDESVSEIIEEILEKKSPTSNENFVNVADLSQTEGLKIVANKLNASYLRNEKGLLNTINYPNFLGRIFGK